MNKEALVFRSKIISLILISMILCFSVYLISYSAVLSGLNSKSDDVKQKLIDSESKLATVEGSIVDRNGEVITYATEPGVPAKCVYPAYGQLVGYNSRIYGVSGLRNRFYKDLFYGDKTNNGAKITLTTDNELQSSAYEAIKGINGAIVILNNSTGEILALATTNSSVEMDVNDLSNWSDLISQDGFFVPNWKVALAPGSVIKAVTAAEIINKNWQDELYLDTGTETIKGHEFHNSNKMAYGNLTLESALVHSANTYFSHMSNKLGSYNLSAIDENFWIGKELELDFTTISSSHGIGESTTVEAAAAGFGQGKLLVTPINMAMIGQAIANDGVMLKPYLISSIENSEGEKYKGESEALCESISPETAKILRSYLKTVANSYGVDAKYDLCAKTGTAELGNGKNNRAAFLSFNKKYTVVVVQNYTKKSGRSLMPIALKMFDILEANKNLQTD